MSSKDSEITPHLIPSPRLQVDEDGLASPALGSRARKTESAEEKEERVKRMAAHTRGILEELGEDPDREGLLATPERMAKALVFLTRGYETSLDDVVHNAVFNEDHDEMVIVKDIDLFSLCEHHMIPFIGKVHIGYLPAGRVIGLSKLARISETFAQRLQVQERLTKQIAEALQQVLEPRGVAVVIEATHMCMSMRGVQKPHASTITSCMTGEFRDNEKTRSEFLSLIQAPRRF